MAFITDDSGSPSPTPTPTPTPQPTGSQSQGGAPPPVINTDILKYLNADGTTKYEVVNGVLVPVQSASTTGWSNEYYNQYIPLQSPIQGMLGGLPQQLITLNDPNKVSIEDQARAWWYSDNLDPSTKSSIRQIAQAYSGWSGPISDEYFFNSFWPSVFKSAAASGKPLFETLNQVAAEAAAGGGAGSSSGGGGGGGGSATTTYYKYTPERDANTILQDALHGYFGRKATEKELVAFKAALRGEEEANPTVVTNDGSGTQTQTGGVDARSFAADWAKSQPGYGNYQAATTFLNGFLNAIGG